MSISQRKSKTLVGSPVDTYLDKLTRRSVETRETIKNDGESTSTFTTSQLGKLFFDMTGQIEKIQIYTRNTSSSAQNIVLKFRAYIDGRDEYDVTLSVPANAQAGWYTYTVRKSWNFERLFIYASSIPSSTGIGYDQNGEPDTFTYDSTTEKWYAVDQRLFIRVILYGFVPILRVGGQLTIQDIERSGPNIVIADDDETTNTGTWISQNHKDAVGGKFIQSSTVNDSVEYTFRGTAVWLRYRTETTCTIDVYFDGTLILENLDISLSIATFTYVFLKKSTEGEHTIKIIVKSGTLSFDSFIYELRRGALQTWTMIEGVVPIHIVNPPLQVGSGGGIYYLYTYEAAPWAYWPGTGTKPSDRILSLLYGSENLLLKQKSGTGELQAEILGSEGLVVKQKATTGELQHDLVSWGGQSLSPKDITSDLSYIGGIRYRLYSSLSGWTSVPAGQTVTWFSVSGSGFLNGEYATKQADSNPLTNVKCRTYLDGTFYVIWPVVDAGEVNYYGFGTAGRYDIYACGQLNVRTWNASNNSYEIICQNISFLKNFRNIIEGKIVNSGSIASSAYHTSTYHLFTASKAVYVKMPAQAEIFNAKLLKQKLVKNGIKPSAIIVQKLGYYDDPDRTPSIMKEFPDDLPNAWDDESKTPDGKVVKSRRHDKAEQYAEIHVCEDVNTDNVIKVIKPVKFLKEEMF
jgi:hypothetical protein